MLFIMSFAVIIVCCETDAQARQACLQARPLLVINRHYVIQRPKNSRLRNYAKLSSGRIIFTYLTLVMMTILEKTWQNIILW
jgi:hypothetical protein